VKFLHSNKKYFALHVATLGLAITAAGLALFFKKKKEEKH
jgi:LPXTG-motif cell wall-anchored protein